MRPALWVLPVLCLVSCASPDLRHAIETGPAAFIPADHPALLAAEAEAAETEALLKLLALPEKAYPEGGPHIP